MFAFANPRNLGAAFAAVFLTLLTFQQVIVVPADAPVLDRPLVA